MEVSLQTRPEASEYDPFYGAYVDAVPDGNILSILVDGGKKTVALLASCPREREEFRYAPAKYSIREVIGHLADAERMYAYRALHFARGAGAALPGMDPEAWVKRSSAANRLLASLAEEFRTVRSATVSLFSSFEPLTWATTGVASGREFSVRSLAYIIAGHEIHHRDILEERYFVWPR